MPASAALADGGPIMPLSEVAAGMACTGETVVQGTTISSFNVAVISVVQVPGLGPRILVRASGPAVDPTGIAEGFSGSPVYCPDASGTMRNAGAISEGVGEYGNDVALVTPIEQMLGEPIDPPSSAPRLAVRSTPLLGPLMVSGLSPSVFGVLQRAGAQIGRVVLEAPARPASASAPQPMVPGASVSASYSSGAIAMGAVGTVTYVNGPTVYAFGHELDGAGRRSLLLQGAYIYYVVNNPDPATGTSFKLAAPGATEGAISSDTPSAVIGSVGPSPRTVPVDVIARDVSTGRVLALDSLVADETDVGLPLGTSQVDTVAPLAVAQAATQIYDGPPADESGTMCLRIYVRESRAPVGFCNRYVGVGPSGDSSDLPPELASAASTDVTNAFAAFERVDFASLHVERVVANLRAARGLEEAAIVRAQARTRVKAGKIVRVRLVVRVHRGRLRTVSFRLRIPRGARGPLIVAIHGPPAPAGPSPAGQGLSGALAAALSGGPPSSGGHGASTPISSMLGLREAVESVASYDGLYATVRGHGKRRVFRDRSLLITGQTTLQFVVAP